MIELFTAKSGAPSLKVDGVAMHSPYDPAREASRFVEETLAGDLPGTVVVLGECIGHVTDAVTRLRPGAHVIAAIYSEEIARAALLSGVPAWHPGDPMSFPDFLRARLDELQVEGLKVLEWPPAARAFPAVSRAANEALRQVIQELNGSFVTTVAAGRLWLRNSVANFLHVEPVLAGSLCGQDRPIVIAAPGPSLEEARELLSETRAQFELWALPSSCAFLLESGLNPDLVVMTDPGFYSMHHLHFDVPACPLAMPLSAARGSWSLRAAGGSPGCPVYFLEQPVVFERELLASARVAAPVLPPHGTVAATAIDLALSSTRAPVIVAGLDLCARDLLSHARPNAFDRLLHLQASRLQPHASLTFHRAAMFGSARQPGSNAPRASAALRTYAGWFDAGLAQGAGRIHRLLPSAVTVSSMLPLDARGLRSLLRSASGSRHHASLTQNPDFPHRSERRQIVSRLVKSWTGELASARDSLRSIGAAVDLGRFPRTLELAHLLAPRSLVDVMKKSRLGTHGAARTAAAEMLAECITIFDRLGGKGIG
jgi:hypothetical protein